MGLKEVDEWLECRFELRAFCEVLDALYVTVAQSTVGVTVAWKYPSYRHRPVENAFEPSVGVLCRGQL